MDRRGPTDQPTDRPTDQPTDRASYRGAMAHLKSKCCQLESLSLNAHQLERLKQKMNFPLCNKEKCEIKEQPE